MLKNGNFLRASFIDNKIDGKALYIMREGDIYIFSFVKGILNGPCTFFPRESKFAIIVYFEFNVFKKFIKKYHFSNENHIETKLTIIKKLFEDSQTSEILYTDKDI